MAFCSKCGQEIVDEAEICIHCGCRTKNATEKEDVKSGNMTRFLLTFLFGTIGSFIINHSSLKPEGWKSRTCAYFFLSILTFGIYPLVASICNCSFDPNKTSNVGYFKE